MTAAALIGALVGLAIGVADFVALGIAGRRGGAGAALGPLKVIRVMSIFVFPVVGWFVGPLVAASLGG